MTERTETTEQSLHPPIPMMNQAAEMASHAETSSRNAIAPQGCGCGNGGNGGNGSAEDAGLESAAPSYIYAIGRVEARFPNLAAEKEFAQAAGREDTDGKTDQQTFYSVLSQRENRYLLRQLCWVFTIQGMETYLLIPRDPADIDLLLAAIRPVKSPLDIDVVIGLRGPIAPPEMCNGLMVPIVAFDQIYSFDQGTLMKALPKPETADATQYGESSEELFGRVIQIADNAGATDEHRALNYLVMRYSGIYEQVADGHRRGSSLTGVEVRPSPMNGTRNIVDTVFSYTNRSTDFTEKFFARVDVTEEFPFLVTKMAPYFER